jgi:hypothetical protein
VTRHDDVKRLFHDPENVTQNRRAWEHYVPAPEGSLTRWLHESPRSTRQNRPGVDGSKPATGVGGVGTAWVPLPHALRLRQAVGRGRPERRDPHGCVRRVSRLEAGAGL